MAEITLAYLKTGIILGVVILLAQGCATPSGEPASGVATTNSSVQDYTPQTNLSGSQRFREVLNLLEDGDPYAARVELMIYLDGHPNSAVAQDLLSQIDLPALDYFPRDFEEIELASGQSLSTLSETYLGSLYRFHALAKYNGIAQPRSIKVGQNIRIPLTPEARMAFAVDPAGSDDGNDTAPRLPSPVEFVPEAAPPVTASAAPSSEEILADRAQGLHKQAVNAFHSQDLDRAIALWDQVLDIDPDFDSARLQRSQSIELKKKLSNLD